MTIFGLTILQFLFAVGYVVLAAVLLIGLAWAGHEYGPKCDCQNPNCDICNPSMYP